MPPKLHHFIWEVLRTCLSVNSNLGKRRIDCDTQCVRCGAEEETINHTLFECPQALYVWTLSKIPLVVRKFPRVSVISNMDNLFWRVPKIHKKDSFS